MVKEITKDTFLLRQKSTPADMENDGYLVDDLLDTAIANEDRCAGLAAIQIKAPRRIITVKIGERFVPMINPMIMWRSAETYTATEGCLSIDGERSVKRHKAIKVAYKNRSGKSKLEQFNGFVAQVIQHEVDHCNGILI